MKTFNDFINESDFLQKRFDLNTKSNDNFEKRKELRNKINDLNQKAEDPKDVITARIATLKLSLLDLDNAKIRINKEILDLSKKISNL